MSKRVCPEPGCPTLTESGRCAKHRREQEQARGSRQARGYGPNHDRLRAKWAPIVATGRVRCWRCREPIQGDQPWDLGHDDHDPMLYRGPEHPACNRATAARR